MDSSSASLDIDDLNARLQLISDAATSPIVSKNAVDTQSIRRQTLTPPSSFTLHPITREDNETRSYHELIRLDGRPVCSLLDFQKAYNTPQQRAKVLIPWLNVLDIENLDREDIKAFTTQLEQWEQFQEWQLETRGMPRTMGNNDSTEFRHFLNEKRRAFRAIGEEQIADGPNFETSMRRQWQQQHDLESHAGLKGQAMNTYKATRETMAVTKRRLRAAGFKSRRPFKFHNDPKEQDERTTWIEYLSFECHFQHTGNDRLRQLGEVNKMEEPELKTGESFDTGQGKPKTPRQRPRRRNGTADPQAEQQNSLMEAQQSWPEPDGSKPILGGGVVSRKSWQQTTKQWHEIQQQRLDWIIAQITSIEASNQTRHVTQSSTKRKRGDNEDENQNEEKDGAQGGSPKKRRKIRGSKPRYQASGLRLHVNTKATQRQRPAAPRQKQSRMMVDLICPIPQTRSTSNDGHRRSVRLHG